LGTARVSYALAGQNDAPSEYRIDAVCVSLRGAGVTQSDRNEEPGELTSPTSPQGKEEAKRKAASSASRRGIGRENHSKTEKFVGFDFTAQNTLSYSRPQRFASFDFTVQDVPV